jgi:two-component system sensor histidine kinase KdpD
MTASPAPSREEERKRKLPISARDFGITLLIAGASAWAAFTFNSQGGDASSALILMLGITLTGAACGLVAALIAAVGVFFFYNFYFAQPILTFRLSTSQDIAPLVLFNLCALITGILAGRLKDRAQAADRSNKYLADLLDLSEALQSATCVEQIRKIVSQRAAARLGIDLLVLPLKDGAIPLIEDAGGPGAWFQIAAQTSFYSDAFGYQDALVGYRLDGRHGALGIVATQREAADRCDPAFLAAFVNLVALALERTMLSEEVADEPPHSVGA